MSRSGYSDDLDTLQLGRWRGQVSSAIRGERGQDFLRELLEALDRMEVKRLIPNVLRAGGEVCALGSIGAARGVELEQFDPWDHETLANVFGIASPLVQEIEWVNDEDAGDATPEERYEYVREWVTRVLKR